MAVLGKTVFMDDRNGVELPRETLRAYLRVVGIGEYLRRGRVMAATGNISHPPLCDIGKNAVRIIVMVW